ncbi:MAG TPA: hypothetical protein VHE13_14025 [Opitutus sp.]|nr:hypothetical protein [Opitutus sp.]
MRAFFARHGITVTAAALSAELPLHAVETAPAALGGVITAAAAKTSVGLSLAHVTKTVAMTATQKLLVATTVIAVLGGLFEAHLIHVRNRELADLRQRTAQLERDLASLRAAHANETRQSAADRDELATLRARLAAFNAGDPAIEDALDSWLQRIVTLKKKLETSPELQIPELKFLTAKDWLDATKETTLGTEMDLRAALSQLRSLAKRHFASHLRRALFRYLQANNNQPPADTAQLGPFFDSPADSAILERWGKFPDGPSYFAVGLDGKPVGWVIREKQPVDPYFDTRVSVSATGFGSSDSSQFGTEVEAAIQSFVKANNALVPTTPAQLAPYLHSDIDPDFVRRRLENLHPHP